VRLRQDVGGADVKKESGEEPEVKNQHLWRHAEQQRRCRTEDRRDRIQREHAQRARRRVPVHQHQAYGVQAIAEIVRDDRDRNGEPDGFRDLKGEADADAVHEAVADQRQCGEHTGAGMLMTGVISLVRTMDQHELLEAVEQQETNRQRDHGQLAVATKLMRQFEALGQELEGNHAEQHPGGEAEHQVQFVAEPERTKPAGGCRAERDQRQTDGVHGFARNKTVSGSAASFGDSLARAAHFRRKVLHLRQAVVHAQLRLLVVDMKAGAERKVRDDGSVNVDQAPDRVLVVQMAAAALAPFAETACRLVVGDDVLGALGDLDRVWLPQSERVDGPGRPGAARFAMAITHCGGITADAQLNRAAEAAALVALAFV